MLYRSYKYSQWDGTQRIFDIDADELMDQLSDEMLRQGDVMRAMRELLRHGFQNQEVQQLTGLRDLMDQLKNRRRQQLQQYNMDSVIDDLKERFGTTSSTPNGRASTSVWNKPSNKCPKCRTKKGPQQEKPV